MFNRPSKLAVSTIQGYRSAISSAVTDADALRSSTALAQLMRSFRIERPVTKKLAPLWNVALVLRYLKKEPFEPLADSSLLNLSLKTLFLVALASGRRRSELSALSVEPACLRFAPNASEVTLLPIKGFLPKNQWLSAPVSKITIPFLAPHVPDDKEALLLCPVLALCTYMDRTSDETIRKGRIRLFLPLITGRQEEIQPREILAWIRQLVRRAHANEHSLSAEQVRPHELRALSASWADFNNLSVDAIMRAAYWRTPSTFMGFYLRNMAEQADDLYSLGPLVTAQTVIHPPT